LKTISERCRTSLFRVMCAISGHREESVAFLIANSPQQAAERATNAYAALHSVGIDEVRLFNLASFQDLVDAAAPVLLDTDLG
jgi:hypothetical protein